jgi:hypothetical protein
MNIRPHARACFARLRGARRARRRWRHSPRAGGGSRNLYRGYSLPERSSPFRSLPPVTAYRSSRSLALAHRAGFSLLHASRVVTSRSEEYRHLASECRRVAQTLSPRDREALVEMAERWDRLADQQERATELRKEGRQSPGSARMPKRNPTRKPHGPLRNMPRALRVRPARL